MPSSAPKQQHSCINTSSNLINTNEDAPHSDNPVERQRLRDRLVHRRYHQKLKARLEELERATTENAKPEEQNNPMKNPKEAFINSSSSWSPTSPLGLQECNTDINQQNESLTIQNSTDLSLEYFPPIPNHNTYLAYGYEEMHNNGLLNPATSSTQSSMPIATSEHSQPSSAQFSGVSCSFPIPMGLLPYSANLYEFMTIPYTSTDPNLAALGHNTTTIAPYMPFSPNTTPLTTEPVLQNGRANIIGSTGADSRRKACDSCRRRKVKCGGPRAKCDRQARERNSQD